MFGTSADSSFVQAPGVDTLTPRQEEALQSLKKLGSAGVIPPSKSPPRYLWSQEVESKRDARVQELLKLDTNSLVGLVLDLEEALFLSRVDAKSAVELYRALDEKTSLLEGIMRSCHSCSQFSNSGGVPSPSTLSRQHHTSQQQHRLCFPPLSGSQEHVQSHPSSEIMDVDPVPQHSSRFSTLPQSREAVRDRGDRVICGLQHIEQEGDPQCGPPNTLLRRSSHISSLGAIGGSELGEEEEDHDQEPHASQTLSALRSGTFGGNTRSEFEGDRTPYRRDGHPLLTASSSATGPSSVSPTSPPLKGHDPGDELELETVQTTASGWEQ